MKILTIIPARGGSKRLKKKNIYPLMGKPMISWVLDECRQSKYIDRTVVSTEDKEIKELCLNNGIEIIDRPLSLSTNKAEKMDVIKHAVRKLEDTENYIPEIIISLQANSPELKYQELDAAIEFFLEKLFPFNPVTELISINPDMLQNACFRIMTRKTVFQKTLSIHVGVFMTDYIDVHTLDDLNEVKRRMNNS